MLIIIIGVVFSIGMGLGVYIMSDEIAAAGIATIGTILSLCLGIIYPTAYYERELVSQTELVALSNSTISQGGGMLFVTVSGKNAYTYRYEIKTDLGTITSKEYETNTISRSNGKIIESEDVNCKVPVLKRYVTKAKATIWSFGIIGDKNEYVFYVPQGTIAKEIKLN